MEDPMGSVLQMKERVIQKEVLVNASLREVWDAWTTSEGVTSFFAPKANVELAIGGPYEIFFDPKDESQGTKGLKVLSYLPFEMLSFQWNAPPQFPNVRKVPTWVVVQFQQRASNQVAVKLTHLGWKEGEERESVFQYFMRAWDSVLRSLQDRFARKITA